MTLPQIDSMIRAIMPPNMLARLDELAVARSASKSFVELVANCAPGSPTNNYRPTIRCKTFAPRPKMVDVREAAENVYLADGFDAAMEALGDDRRAYRG
jgi:hypothetical protein